MGFCINAKDITTNYTQTLAEFTANLKYEDIPPEVLERANGHTDHWRLPGCQRTSHGGESH